MPAILLTRPEGAARRFAAQLRARIGDAEIVISPLLGIRWRGQITEGADTIPVFTSRYGVTGFMQAGGTARGPCWCVGDGTAQAAADAGFLPNSAQGDADALVAALLRDPEPGRYRHFRGEHARGDVAARLATAGLPADEKVVYEQVLQGLNEPAQNLLQRENPVIIPLFSPRTAAQFVRERRGKAPLHVVGMSRAILDEVKALDAETTLLAARPDGPAMLDAVEGLFDAALHLEGGRGSK